MPSRPAIAARAPALVVLLACLAGFAMPAAGSSLAGALRGSPFQFFTEEDTRQFIATARALADEEKPDPDGKRWANEASGAWGTMAVTRSFRRSGAPCREIRGENTARNRTEAFRLVVCRTPQGEWKIASSGPPPAR
jgi:surface antigen